MYQTKSIEKWIYYRFEPVECKTGKDFMDFVRSFKSELKAQINGSGYEMIKFSKGYFFISGFLYNKNNGKYMYFSAGDVRDTGVWHNRILVREARHENDYTGGRNQYTSFEDFGAAAIRILECRHSEFAA